MDTEGDSETASEAGAFERSLKIVTRTVAPRAFAPDDEVKKRFRTMRLAALAMFGGSLLLNLMFTLPSFIVGTGIALAIVLARAAFEPVRRDRRIRTVGHETFVRVTTKGIKAKGRPFLAAETVAAGFYQPRHGAGASGSVCCTDGKGELLFEAEVESEEEARAFLHALGRDVDQQRISFGVWSPLRATRMRELGMFALAPILFALGLMLTGARGPLSIFLSLLVPIVALAVAWLDARVDVGTDGLLMRWLGRSTFLPYDEILSVMPRNQREILLVCAKRRPITIALPMDATGLDELQRDALLARIEEAREAFRYGSKDDDLAARVARRSRDVATWRAELASFREQGGTSGYRRAPTREEDLWRLVEDPSAKEDVRAAAALLLRDHPEAAPRLRVAADAVASPKLRVVLSTVAEKDAEDQRIDRALEELDTETTETTESAEAGASEDERARLRASRDD